MTDRLVTLDVAGSSAVIRLNRPARHNALVSELLAELLDAINDERCQKTRTLILAAEGRSFSTGGDLLGFWQHRDNIAEYAHSTPIACAVQGQVTGGSLGLLLAADHVVMQHEVQITPWYAEVGFSPDGGWTALLPHVIGHQQSLRWICCNESLSAADCLELGIAHELVAADALAATQAWCEHLDKLNGKSIASTRELLNADTERLSQKLEAERVAFVKQIQTPEAIDGIARFLGM